MGAFGERLAEVCIRSAKLSLAISVEASNAPIVEHECLKAGWGDLLHRSLVGVGTDVDGHSGEVIKPVRIFHVFIYEDWSQIYMD